MSLLDDQLKQLSDEFKGATIEKLPSGSHVITIPNIQLPPGWSVQNTSVKFLVLANYPHSKPDCFWIDPMVRLSNGAVPKSTNFQIIPETGYNWLWFSWHANTWNPNRDSLLTYMRVIERRLRDAQ